jgi:hypothetical protein
MANALKKQRKRAQRKAHARNCETRNRERGFSTSDLIRAGGNPDANYPAKENQKAITSAKADSMVGAKRASYHKPKLPIDEIELDENMGGIEIMSKEHYDILRARARSRKRGFAKVAEAAGWKLTGADVNDRLSWTRA